MRHQPYADTIGTTEPRGIQPPTVDGCHCRTSRTLSGGLLIVKCPRHVASQDKPTLAKLLEVPKDLNQSNRMDAEEKEALEIRHRCKVGIPDALPRLSVDENITTELKQ